MFQVVMALILIDLWVLTQDAKCTSPIVKTILTTIWKNLLFKNRQIVF